MGSPPFRPLTELKHELAHGNLPMATAIAQDYTREYHRHIPLGIALSFLPLVAVQEDNRYDTWACRWLARWLIETDSASTQQAAELAVALAELPIEPDTTLTNIQQMLGL
jgi:hypothetical protein